ncbi:4-hydroxy-tetrahydrodipicolinate synthase [Sediminihabitans luteus]|uniref:4-hydroxy-tetrahydrodipicolinate synthase n=1 Tax=Sediminihabitans luteus TaxID=1138585 RepID=A0A2M9CPY8_9CELL|nr:4-hydroxy-tetrahydrodipicolinate synthase [Sediminihabitans luteus]
MRVTSHPGPFHGLLAYPVTPLAADGAPDLRALADLVAGALDAGADAVTVLASSGAGTSFDRSERDLVVRAAVAAAASAPVHVAVSAPTTRDVVRFGRDAVDAGAAGLLIAPFAYGPLVDDEVEAHVRALCDATAAPVCFYNKPLQTGYDLTPEFFARLVRETTVHAVKDPATLPARPRGRAAALRAALASSDVTASVGLSMDVALLDDAEAADAWHTGLAALAPVEYVAVRRDRVDGTEHAVEARRWLLAVATALTAMRPLGGLHALAELLGTPAGAPRGPALAATRAQVDVLRDLVAQRPT